MSEAAIRLHVEPLDEGGFVATSPDVSGLVVEGRSLVEVAEIAQDVVRKIAESCREHGDPLPPARRSYRKLPGNVLRSGLPLATASLERQCLEPVQNRGLVPRG